MVIRVRVVDAARRPIRGATVYVARSPRPAPDIAQLTDASGTAVVPAPAPGEYELGGRSDSLWGNVLIAVRDSDVEVELVLQNSISSG